MVHTKTIQGAFQRCCPPFGVLLLRGQRGSYLWPTSCKSPGGSYFCGWFGPHPHFGGGALRSSNRWNVCHVQSGSHGFLTVWHIHSLPSGESLVAFASCESLIPGATSPRLPRLCFYTRTQGQAWLRCRCPRQTLRTPSTTLQSPPSHFSLALQDPAATSTPPHSPLRPTPVGGSKTL